MSSKSVRAFKLRISGAADSTLLVRFTEAIAAKLIYSEISSIFYCPYCRGTESRMAFRQKPLYFYKVITTFCPPAEFSDRPVYDT